MRGGWDECEAWAGKGGVRCDRLGGPKQRCRTRRVAERRKGRAGRRRLLELGAGQAVKKSKVPWGRSSEGAALRKWVNVSS